MKWLIAAKCGLFKLGTIGPRISFSQKLRKKTYAFVQNVKYKKHDYAPLGRKGKVNNQSQGCGFISL